MKRAPAWQYYLIHTLALAPLALTAVEYFTSTLPIVLDQHLIIRFGAAGLAFLAASFSITPIGTLTGRTELVPLRRPLGVYAFCYLTLHFLAYAWLSNGFDWGLIWRDLGERRAMSAGLLALLLLLPLALTSTDGWQKRLGRRWKQLHRLVYLAVALSLLHYWWLERDLHDWVWVYTAYVAVLFALRWPAIRRALASRRHALPARGAGADADR
jgi:sulfoxide reductase heme-binding subunit YedZ